MGLSIFMYLFRREVGTTMNHIATMEIEGHKDPNTEEEDIPEPEEINTEYLMRLYEIVGNTNFMEEIKKWPNPDTLIVTIAVQDQIVVFDMFHSLQLEKMEMTEKTFWKEQIHAYIERLEERTIYLPIDEQEWWEEVE